VPPSADFLPRPPPGRHHRTAGAHRLAGHAPLASVPGGAGPHRGGLGLPPPASYRQARPARAATPRSRVEGRREARRDGGAARPCDTDTPHGRRGAAAGRHREARAWGDRRPGPAVPQAGPRRTPRALPALVVAARLPRHREPSRAGEAPSRVGWCSWSWRDALPGVAGSPDPGRGLSRVASRALGAQRWR